LEDETKALQTDLAVARTERQVLEKRVAALETEETHPVQNGTQLEPTQPIVPAVEFEAANNLAAASAAVPEYCHKLAMFDKAAEAKCLEEQSDGLDKLIKGRPLGVGITPAIFAAARVKCA